MSVAAPIERVDLDLPLRYSLLGGVLSPSLCIGEMVTIQDHESDAPDRRIAMACDDATARFICAALNACEGMSVEALEASALSRSDASSGIQYDPHVTPAQACDDLAAWIARGHLDPHGGEPFETCLSRQMLMTFRWVAAHVARQLLLEEAVRGK